MLAKPRTAHKSNKSPRDEPAAPAAETKVPARNDRFPGPVPLDPRHQMIACAACCRAEKRGFAGDAEPIKARVRECGYHRSGELVRKLVGQGSA